MKVLINDTSSVAARKPRYWHYFVYCLYTTVTCVAFFIMFWEMIKADVRIRYIVATASAFLIIANGVIIYLTAFVRDRFLTRPMEMICDAARRVASGDFSVKIEPIHKGRHNAESEALFNDFNTMVAELRSIEILKSDFVSNVSHELKTPLAVIQTYSTMLQGDDLSDVERKEYCAKIAENTERMTYLITNVLQLSRLENQKTRADKKQYILSEQLCRCTLNYENELDEKEIELDTDFDDEIILNSDEQLLDIVFNNLLSNALKFTEKGGSIRIISKSEDDYAVVSIADSGCGMTEGQVKHIFEKFYQADASHATKGNGLGLALVYEIVNLLDGSIDVESEPGKGSKFTVKIKLK